MNKFDYEDTEATFYLFLWYKKDASYMYVSVDVLTFRCGKYRDNYLKKKKVVLHSNHRMHLLNLL